MKRYSAWGSIVATALVVVGWVAFGCSAAPPVEEETAANMDTKLIIVDDDTVYRINRLLKPVREFQLEDGTRCVVVLGNAIDCDWGCSGQDN